MTARPTIATATLMVVALVVVGLCIRKAVTAGQATGAAADLAPDRGDSAGVRGAEASIDADMMLVDVTQEVGLLFEHQSGATGDFWLPEEMGSGGAFLDFDNDEDLDVYLVQGGAIGSDDSSHRNRLFRNDGGRFVDVSHGSGADLPGYGMGCATGDYDNDGDVDIFVTRLGPDVLLRNEGDGTFSNVTVAAGVDSQGFGASAAFFDYDRDGWLDLFVVRYVDWAPHKESSCYAPGSRRDYCSPLTYDAPSHDLLFRNLGDGTFADVSADTGIAAAEGNGLGLACGDFDEDGWLDVFVANDQTPGFLWINNQGGGFTEQGAMRGAAFNADGMLIAGMGVECQDLDNDGDDDLVVTNIVSQPHLGLRNEGGFFEDASHAWGLGGWGVPLTGFGIGLFDQDCDGSLDGFVANGAVNLFGQAHRAEQPYAEPNQFIRRDASGRFYDASVESGLGQDAPEMSRGVVLGDYDNDGDVDVLVTNNRGPAQLLRNENSTGNAWLLLDLQPANGCRHAINARVAIEAGGQLRHFEVRPNIGYLTSNDPRLHIGLADADRVDRILVHWPDGRIEQWRQIDVRQRLRLVQGGGEYVNIQTNHIETPALP